MEKNTFNYSKDSSVIGIMERVDDSIDGDCSGGGGGADSDVEMDSMRKELVDFGLAEEDLSKQEMSDLLKALRCSRSSATEEELQRSKGVPDTEVHTIWSSKIETTSKMSLGETVKHVHPARTGSSESTEVDGADAYVGDSVSQKVLRRRYRAAADRRLPWCMLPADLTPAQRAHCLAAYAKLLSVNQYWRARSLADFEQWAPGVSISTGAPAGPARATRSGRCVPSYTNLVDDDDDAELFVPKKTRKRRVSHSETSTSNDGGIYTNKTLSLKRKTQKSDCDKPEKESKIEELAEVSIWSLEPVNNLNHEKVDVQKSSDSFCTIIDSIYNSTNGDKINMAKDQTRITKSRQRKT